MLEKTYFMSQNFYRLPSETRTSFNAIQENLKAQEKPSKEIFDQVGKPEVERWRTKVDTEKR